MKKSIYTLLFIGASALSVQAQSSCVPDFLSTVAVIRDGAGIPITTTVDLQVELYYGDPSTTGTKIYCEQQQNITPNSFGEVSVQFGSAGPNLCPPNVPLSSINWDNCTAGEVWYRIYWRITGGSLALIAENNFATVPYAFLSRKAETATTAETALSVQSISTANPSNDQSLVYNSTSGNFESRWPSLPTFSDRKTGLSTAYNTANLWTYDPVACPSITPTISGSYLVSVTMNANISASTTLQWRLRDVTTANTVISNVIGDTPSGVALSQYNCSHTSLEGLQANHTYRIEVHSSTTSTWQINSVLGNNVLTAVRIGD